MEGIYYIQACLIESWKIIYVDSLDLDAHYFPRLPSTPSGIVIKFIYRVSGLSCPEAQAYLTVIFHSFLHNNNINSDYILGANIYFTPHSIFSSYF